MTLFFCRVQLEGTPSEAAYENLHNAMAKEGFYRKVRDTANVIYHLPHAEYCISNDEPLNTINERAKRAAASVQPDYRILTIQAANWSGWLTKTT